MEGTGSARGTGSLGLHPELTYLNHKGLWYVAQQKLELRELIWFGQVFSLRLLRPLRCGGASGVLQTQTSDRKGMEVFTGKNQPLGGTWHLEPEVSTFCLRDILDLRRCLSCSALLDHMGRGHTGCPETAQHQPLLRVFGG